MLKPMTQTAHTYSSNWTHFVDNYMCYDLTSFLDSLQKYYMFLVLWYANVRGYL